VDQNIRYALRSLIETPVVTVTAVLSVALGIGANATMFTLINTLFLNPRWARRGRSWCDNC